MRIKNLSCKQKIGFSPLLWVLMEFIPGFVNSQDSLVYRLGIGITDKDSSYVLEGVRLSIKNLNTEKIDSFYPVGEEFEYKIKLGQDYILTFEKDEYFKKQAKITSCNLKDKAKKFCAEGFLELSYANQNIFGYITMKKIRINESFRLENIYYDYNKYFIRPDAAVSLDKLVTLLRENPYIAQVELSSHTDSRGNDQYNLTLSDRRAKAAVAYILSKGIQKSRIIAQGYGEQKILKCPNGSVCSEEEHQENRRTEIKILRLNRSGSF